MTVVTNTYQTFTQIGNRESLSDTIYNISPEDTPFVSAIGKTKASAKFWEWQTDSLGAIDLANKQVEGDDADFPVIVPTVRLGNRTQILRKSLIISGTAETVEHAGRKSEISYQIAMRMKEIKRDLEGILIGLNQAASAGNSSTAATMATVLSWLTTNTSFGAGAGADPVTIGTTTRTNGDLRDLSELQLATVLAAIYTASGEQPEMILTPPGLKADISAFPGNATRYIEATTKKIVAGVNLYSGDFGEYKIVPDRHMRGREVLILNTDYWKLATLRPLKVEDLAKTGDAIKKMLIMEVTLESSNEAASGGIFDVQAAS